MQDILPPSRGRIRPVLRTSPERAYSTTSRRPATASIATSSPATPKPAHKPASHSARYHPGLLVDHLLATSTKTDSHSSVPHRLRVLLARTTYKLHLIERLNDRLQQPRKVKHATKPQKERVAATKPPSKRPVLTGAVIVLILAVTGYVSFDTWQTNNLAKQAFAKNATVTESTALSSTDRQKAEGKDESPLPQNALLDYRVASNLPRALYINKLNVAARVLPMGVNADGSMQAPLGIYDAGWYSGSVRPGETGAMVLNGHSSGPTRQALLGRLDTLRQGDEIAIEKGDKTRLTYKVVHTETVPLEAVDMNKVALPYGTTQNGLNLYTCTGEWLPSKQTFDHRVIVYAAEVK